MKQYVETQEGNYTIDGMCIPADNGNRHYAQMLAEISEGTAEVKAFDHDAQAKIDKAAEERAWRDAELDAADKAINTIEDVGGDATNFHKYRVALRDYPQQQGFPECARPTLQL